MSSTMSHARADATINAALRGTATPHLWLHTADPGLNGTNSVAVLGATPIVRKPITFGAIESHPVNDERRVLSTANITWTGTEISVGQTLTHASVWSALTGGVVEFIGTLAAAKIPGSDGVIIATGDLEIAIGVFAEPV